MSEHDDLLHRLLVLRTQAGDRGALEQLIEIHQARLSYYLAKIIGDVSAAEDLLQETWLKVFMRIGKLRDPSAFTSWLYRIARNRAYKLLGHRRGHVDLAAVDAMLASAGPALASVDLPEGQEVTPRMTFTVKPDGHWISKPLEDMYPLLERTELRDQMVIDVWDED